MKTKMPKNRNPFALHARLRNGAGVHEKTGKAKTRHERRKAKQKGFSDD